MTIKQLIEQLRAQVAEKLTARNTLADQLGELRSAETTDEAKVAEVRSAKDALDAEIDTVMERVRELEAEQARDEAIERLATEVRPTGATRDGGVAETRVTGEPRTYSPETDKRGSQFLRDVASAFFGDFSATQRLERHMAEEMSLRGGAIHGQQERATGTGAFSGLVVPQYLTDMYAPKARAGRPFADAINHHDLPPTGMVVNISQITTGTTTALQSSENGAVSETDADDTLLSIPVQTISGQQTISRQAVERGAGVEDVTLDDLFRAYATVLDSTLLNQTTTGLTNVANTVAYTDGTPTALEMYPKILNALANVEAALLDQDPGDNIAVMHSRRWYWLQSQVSSSWPLVNQPNIPAQMGFTNLAEAYGSGVRGVLPNGTAVIVDNNIGTTLGAGTEDEVYVGSRREFHLWEDPSAPMLIRAEQTKAASLGLLLVVYGYIAYTHTRYAHAQKIAGTGLIAPTF